MTGLKFSDDSHLSSIYLSKNIEEEKRREEKRRSPVQLVAVGYRVHRSTKDNFDIVAKLRGFVRKEDALEQAMLDWIERNRPASLQIINMAPISVSVAKVDKLEARIVIDDLRDAFNIVSETPREARGYPEFVRKLVEQLKKAMIVQQRTRDPELTSLIQQVEAQIQ